MEIKYICPYWGQDTSIDSFIQKALSAGFDGVEIYIQNNEQFLQELKASKWIKNIPFVAQQYLPPAKESFDDYRKKYLDLLKVMVQLSPLFINSHTGKDFFTFEQNCQLLKDAQEIALQSGVTIVHETHRGRFAFHLALIQQYIEKYDWLRFNADISHLCVVSESLLEDQTDALMNLLKHSDYIHARVGQAQAPQVSNPFAPEWVSHLETFSLWWQMIVNFNKNQGKQTFYICSEFGPVPYMPVIPFSQIPLADQWEINVDMMNYLKENLRG